MDKSDEEQFNKAQLQGALSNLADAEGDAYAVLRRQGYSRQGAYAILNVMGALADGARDAAAEKLYGENKN